MPHKGKQLSSYGRSQWQRDQGVSFLKTAELEHILGVNGVISVTFTIVEERLFQS
jgi:hypothetical protein